MARHTPTNNNQQQNSIPKFLFTPFKVSRILSVIFNFISMALAIYLIVNVYWGKILFTSEQLKDLSDFVLNLVLVIAATGFTIFRGLSIVSPQPQSEQEKLLFSYIGHTFLLTSITIMSYVISFCPFLINFENGKIISLYFCLCMILMTSCITRLLSTIVAYFNIRD